MKLIYVVVACLVLSSTVRAINDPYFSYGIDTHMSWRSDKINVPDFNVLVPRWMVQGDFRNTAPAIGSNGDVYAVRARTTSTTYADVYQQGVTAVMANGTVKWNIYTDLSYMMVDNRLSDPAITATTSGERLIVGMSNGAVLMIDCETGVILSNSTRAAGNDLPITRVLADRNWVYARTLNYVMKFQIVGAKDDILQLYWENKMKNVMFGSTFVSDLSVPVIQRSYSPDQREASLHNSLVVVSSGDVIAIAHTNSTSSQSGSAVYGFSPSGMDLSWSPIYSSTRLLNPCARNNLVFFPSEDSTAFALNSTSGLPAWGGIGVIDSITTGIPYLNYPDQSLTYVASGTGCAIFGSNAPAAIFNVRTETKWIIAAIGLSDGILKGYQTAFPPEDVTWYQDTQSGGTISQIYLSETTPQRFFAMSPNFNYFAKRITLINDEFSVDNLWMPSNNEFSFNGRTVYPQGMPALGPFGWRAHPVYDQNDNQYYGLLYAACDNNTIGYACETCDSGYFQLDSQCVLCPDYGVLLYIVAIFIFLVVVLFLAKFGSAPSFAPFTQFVNFLQVFSVLTVISIKWPITLRSIMGWFSFVNINLDAAGPECQSDLLKSFAIRYSFFMLILPLFYLLMLGLYGIARLLHKCGLSDVRTNKFTDALKKAALSFARLAFLPFLVKTISYFDCTKRANAASDGGDLWTLDSYPAWYCWQGEYWNSFAAIFIGLIFTITTVVIILKNTSRHHPQAGTPRFENVYGSMYERYKSSYRWWEIAILSRKGLIAAVGLLTATSAGVATGMTLVVLIFFLFATIVFRPFRKLRNQVLEAVLVFGNLTCTVIAIVSTSDSQMEDSSPTAIAITVLMCLVLVGALGVTLWVVLLEVRDKKGKNGPVENVEMKASEKVEEEKEKKEEEGEGEKEKKEEEGEGEKEEKEEEGEGEKEEKEEEGEGEKEEKKEDDEFEVELMHSRVYTLRHQGSDTLLKTMKEKKEAELKMGGLVTPFADMPKKFFRIPWLAFVMSILTAVLVIAGWLMREQTEDTPKAAPRVLVTAGVALHIYPAMLIVWCSLSIRSFFDHPKIVGRRVLRRIVYVCAGIAFACSFFISGKVYQNFASDPKEFAGWKAISIVWAVAYLIIATMLLIDYTVVIKQAQSNWDDLVKMTRKLAKSEGK